MLYSYHSMPLKSPKNPHAEAHVADTVPAARPGRRRAATPPPPRLCRRARPVRCHPSRGSRQGAPQTPPQPAEGCLPSRGRPGGGVPARQVQPAYSILETQKKRCTLRNQLGLSCKAPQVAFACTCQLSRFHSCMTPTPGSKRLHFLALRP